MVYKFFHFQGCDTILFVIVTSILEAFAACIIRVVIEENGAGAVGCIR